MSPMITDMQRPSSLRKVSASAHMGPKYSIAIDTKILIMANSLYFANLRANFVQKWYENINNGQFAVFR